MVCTGFAHFLHFIYLLKSILVPASQHKKTNNNNNYKMSSIKFMNVNHTSFKECFILLFYKFTFTTINSFLNKYIKKFELRFYCTTDYLCKATPRVLLPVRLLAITVCYCIKFWAPVYDLNFIWHQYLNGLRHGRLILNYTKK